MIPQHADFERCKWCNERVRPNGGCLWYPTPAGEDVNYHRLKPVACERLSETKQLD